jgi:hypothetical protein
MITIICCIMTITIMMMNGCSCCTYCTVDLGDNDVWAKMTNFEHGIHLKNSLARSLEVFNRKSVGTITPGVWQFA